MQMFATAGGPTAQALCPHCVTKHPGRESKEAVRTELLVLYDLHTMIDLFSLFDFTTPEEDAEDNPE